MAVLVPVSIALAALCALTYWYFTRNFSFWKRHGIPYEPPLPFLGNLKEAVLQTLDIGQTLKKIYDKHKDKPYVGFFSFDSPSLMLVDPEMVKNVLVKDSHNFIDRVQTADASVDPITGNAIFALKGQKWKHVRMGMTPVFTTGKMKKMFDIVDNTAEHLRMFLQDKSDMGIPVPVKETMARFTTDVIASVAFGVDSNSLKNPDAEFRRYMRKAFHFDAVKSFATLAISFAPHLQSFFKIKIVAEDVASFLRSTIWTTVSYRENNKLDRKDFLDSMMELRKKGREQEGTLKIDGDDFVAQSFAFLSAGFETSSTTLSFALYELSLHEDMQSTLREEIRETLAKYKKLTYEAIQDMPFLDKVVSETLRKYPIVPYLDRMTLKDYQLPGTDGKGSVTLKAGTGVYVPVYALHHDHHHFPEPSRFDPQRFNEDNKKTRHHFAYLPFGEGPRNCLGMRFGLMQTKLGLAKVIQYYEVSPCKETPIPIQIHPKPFLIQALGEIPLLFNRIN